MRMVFLLLVLANFAFFAWDRYLRIPQSAAARIQQVQMTPEKIRIVKPQQLAQPRVAAAPEPAVLSEPDKVNDKIDPKGGNRANGNAEEKPAACLMWGVFVGPPDAARADAVMAAAKWPPAQVRRVITDVDGHWVLIPPQKTQEEAARAVDTLKKLGVNDFNIVSEPPQWRNAISLGVFRSEETARVLRDELQKKGVKDVGLERRPRFFQQMAYYLREPDKAAMAKLRELSTRVAGTEVKAVACPE